MDFDSKCFGRFDPVKNKNCSNCNYDEECEEMKPELAQRENDVVQSYIKKKEDEEDEKDKKEKEKKKEKEEKKKRRNDFLWKISFSVLLSFMSLILWFLFD